MSAHGRLQVVGTEAIIQTAGEKFFTHTSLSGHIMTDKSVRKTQRQEMY